MSRGVRRTCRVAIAEELFLVGLDRCGGNYGNQVGCVDAFGLRISVFPWVRSLATSFAESSRAAALSLDLRIRGDHSFRDDKHHLRTGHRFRLGRAVSESAASKPIGPMCLRTVSADAAQ